VPLQNTDAFQFLDNLVDTGLEYETAGSLRGGQQVFIAAKLPQTINIGGDDKHELYLFARNAFDGRNAVTIGVTPVRIVCMNTLNLALKGAKRTWSVPHLGTMAGRLEEAREALDLSFAYADAFEREGNRLVAQKLSDKAFDEFLASLTEDMGERSGEKARDNIRGIYTTSTTVAGTGHTGTAWGALNAAGEYFDWVRPTRTDEARLIGSLEGVAVKARDRALALLS
jgi:phage/plasmid-like protein (TIGR03299 family)